MTQNMKIHKNTNLYLFTFILLLFASCISTKKIKIFSEIKNDTSTDIVNLKSENFIKPGDMLQITVFSQDEVAKSILNNVGSATAGFNYLVDDSGFIKLPMLGLVKSAGLSKVELETKLINALVGKKILLDAIISVRIINFKITILGEVNSPGVITIQNERVSIVEALGLAGDLTVYAKRDNILLIREQDGKRLYKRFSLNDPSLFNKDFYYLQNRDVLYIEPSKSKAASIDRSTQFVSIGLSFLSVILLVYSQVISK